MVLCNITLRERSESCLMVSFISQYELKGSVKKVWSECWFTLQSSAII